MFETEEDAGFDDIEAEEDARAWARAQQPPRRRTKKARRGALRRTNVFDRPGRGRRRR